MLKKVSQMVLLQDFYGSLLTQKQQNVLNLYYENDWSLSEIADGMNTSRQAVYDIVKRAERLLQQYEQKMGLVERFQMMRSRLQDLSATLEGAKIDQSQINQAVGIIKEITDLL